MIFDANKYIKEKLTPSNNRISNMYVYSHIVELSSVGNSHVPITKIFPIKNNFQESGHWVINVSMYIMVREKNIRSITI